MAGPKPGLPPPSCSVCLDTVSDGRERSIAKLMCGHQFHLDCIGSAFNAKGSMQCPNCRHIENGQWLYANGCRQHEDSLLDEIINEEEYDMLAEVSEFLYPQDLMHFGHLQWCPYQSSYTQLSLSLGDTENSPAAHPDLVVNVLFDENVGSADPVQPCPFLQGQGSTMMRHIPNSQDNLQAQETSVHQRGPRQHQYSPSRAHWSQRASTRFGIVRDIATQDISRLPRSDSRTARDPTHAYYRYSRRERNVSSAQQSASRQPRQYPENQMPTRTLNRDLIGTSINGGESIHGDSTTFSQRREGTSAFRQYSTEPEVQRWAPPPLSGLYGLHSIRSAEISTEAGFRASDTHQFQSPLQYFQSFMTDSGIGTGSFQPSTSFNNPM